MNAATVIDEVLLWRVRVPLSITYNTAIAAIDALDSIVVQVRMEDGRRGIGETTVIPGYAFETVDGAWEFCRTHAERIVGLKPDKARCGFDPFRHSDPHAVSALQMAIEMAEGNPLLAPPAESRRVAILAPVNDKALDRIPDEIEARIAEGYGTLKVKVGWDVDADLRRLALIQRICAGRVLLRVDANQGYARAEGRRFATSLNPEALQLLEQPCAADDWAANAAVAERSPVPVMMDESIYGLADIDRAAAMTGCGFVKLKIAKMSGATLLLEGLQRIRARGLVPILGNGVATDIGCWVEASVMRHIELPAGEMNGFLKNRAQLLTSPPRFDKGAIVLEPSARPELDLAALDRLGAVCERYAPARLGA